MEQNRQVLNISILPADYESLSSEDKLIILKALKISLTKKQIQNTTQGTNIQTQLTGIETAITALGN